MTRHDQDQAERLARELAREALFLPDRWRAWLLHALSEDLEAADLEQHRHAVLNARMSKAVEILERVAEHLKLNQEQRLSLTMREFDAAPKTVREDFSARRVADAIRGSWELAKSIAFTDERLPVVPERYWERGKGLARKRREATFALSGVLAWLETEPAEKTRASYDRWSEAINKKLEDGQRPFLRSGGLQRQWPFPWSEIVEAVQAGRLPGEEVEDEQAQPSSAPTDTPTRSHVFQLDPQLRARRLRSARERRGWSAKQVADAAGIDASTLRKLEDDKASQVGFETIAKLAEVLGLQLNDFVSAD